MLSMYNALSTTNNQTILFYLGWSRETTAQAIPRLGDLTPVFDYRQYSKLGK